uniref:RNA-directed DNA polymerase n=1 Tax=Strigamia maritima TaxID=126957 RepID=T1IN61_STRMM
MDELCKNITSTKPYIDDIGQTHNDTDALITNFELFIAANFSKKKLNSSVTLSRRTDAAPILTVWKQSIVSQIHFDQTHSGVFGFRQLLQAFHPHFRENCDTSLSIDASHDGLGACLQQEQDGKTVTIAFASRAIPKSYASAHSNELECLAVHWAVTEKFRFYLLPLARFTIYTDNWAVAHITSKKEINRKYAGWVLDLQEFSFVIKRKRGADNTIPDALSRIVDHKTRVMSIIKIRDHQLRMEQEQDEFCNSDSAKGNEFLVQKKLLCRLDDNHLKIVIPASLTTQMITNAHEEGNHADAWKTLSRLLSRFWWPHMSKQVKETIKSCKNCLAHNRLTHKTPGLLHPRKIPRTPFHTIAMDHAGPFTGYARLSHILVLVDLTTRFVVAVPLKGTKTLTTIKALTDAVFKRFGTVKRIITDSFSSFTSAEMTEFCEENSISLEHTPPYFHQANGLAERTIQTINQGLRKFPIMSDG